MIWLDLLRKLWPYLAAAGLLTGGGLYLHHAGYESGYATSEKLWQASYAKAVATRDAANEKARRTEESSKALSEQIEKQHVETLASLQTRAADASLC